MDHQRKRAGENNEVHPDEDDLDLGIRARTTIFARHVRVDSEKLAEVFHQISAAKNGQEEQAGENQADEKEGVRLHPNSSCKLGSAATSRMQFLSRIARH